MRHGRVNMFVCGPTVYDYIHIGNARTFVVFDVVAKYLRHKGYQVDYIQNITDIEDKITQRAQETNHEPLVLAKEFEEKFLDDMKALEVTAVSDYERYARATDHIEEVKKQVQTLIDRGNAYLIEDDGWYFDLKTFPDYGKLSGRTVQMAEDAVSRIDENPNKRNRGDFALWKFCKPGEPSWPANFSASSATPTWELSSQVVDQLGRPGWHIEDTAITEKYFGPQYDIHGGGQDLIFPHHEAEIAQQESASGLKPFVKHWMHVGFLINKDQKMSKSTGNFTTLRDALTKYSPETLRFYFLSAHYRSPLDLNDNILNQAEAAVARIAEFRNRLKKFKDKNIERDNDLAKVVQEFEEKIITCMENDFDTPRAIGGFFELIRYANQHIENGVSPDSIIYLDKIFSLFDKVFGIVRDEVIIMPDEVQNLVNQREDNRSRKDFDSADKIRQEIESLGYQVDDTTYGPLVKKT